MFGLIATTHIARHTTRHTKHYILHVTHHALQTTHYTPRTIHHTSRTAHYTPHTTHKTSHNIHFTPHATHTPNLHLTYTPRYTPNLHLTYTPPLGEHGYNTHWPIAVQGLSSSVPATLGCCPPRLLTSEALRRYWLRYRLTRRNWRVIGPLITNLDVSVAIALSTLLRTKFCISLQ